MHHGDMQAMLDEAERYGLPNLTGTDHQRSHIHDPRFIADTAATLGASEA